MGAKQSKLKKEVERLKTEAVQSNAKLQKEAEILQNEKRALEYKLGVLEEMAAQAQLEAETAIKRASDSEERAEALKWELVRHLSVPIKSTNGAIASPVSSLSPPASLSPQVSMRWKLKDDVKLRRSNRDVLNESSRTLEAKGTNQEAIIKPVKNSIGKAATNQAEQVPEESKSFKEPKSTTSMDIVDTFVPATSSNFSSSDEDKASSRTKSIRAKR